jgi:hypothetical protein
MVKIDTKKAILLFFTFLNFIIAAASVVFVLTFAYIMFQGGDSLSACFLVFLSIFFGAIGIITICDYYNDLKQQNN